MFSYSLVSWVLYSVYNSLVRYGICKCFLPVCILVFHLLNSVFSRAKVFNFDEVQLINLFFIDVLLVSYLDIFAWSEVTKTFCCFLLAILYLEILCWLQWSILSAFFIWWELWIKVLGGFVFVFVFFTYGWSTVVTPPLERIFFPYLTFSVPTCQMAVWTALSSCLTWLA